jgi:putative ABC transport system permease protein
VSERPRRNTGVTRFSPASLWVFAFRNLMSRPTRTLLALVGLSIPVVGVLGLLSLSAAIRGLLRDTLAQVQGILVIRENAPTDLFSDLPASIAQTLRQVRGVRVVAPQIWKIAPSIEGRSRIVGTARDLLSKSREQPLRSLLNVVQVEGQDLDEHRRLRSDVYRVKMIPKERGGGRFLEPADRGLPHAVISARIAREFPDEQGEPRRVGGQLRIGGRPFTIVGVYDTGSMLLDNTIVMDIATARQLLNLEEGVVSCFLVEPADPDRTDEVAGMIERTVAGVDARTMSEFQLGAGRLLGHLDSLLLLIISLALVVGSVGILNTMLMSTSERLAEFGILRTTGWSRGELLSLVLAESFLLGLFAGLLGCLLAALAIVLVNPYLDFGVRLAFAPWMMLLGLVLALVLGTLGGIYPAWSASRRLPMEVVRLGSR